MIILITIIYNPSDQNIEDLSISHSDHNYLKLFVINKATEEQELLLKKIHNSILIKNYTNLGIAAAINQGICEAKKRKSSYIMILDQDSLINKRIIKSLAKDLSFLHGKNIKVGSISPSLIDKKGNIFNSRNSRNNDKESLLFLGKIETVATSGQLIPMQVIDDIGGMDESLFIDGVDHEWCFRAKHEGYEIVVSKNVTLEHDIGSNIVHFYGKGKPIHTNPVRHYYIIRNSLFLIKRPYIPLRWRFIELLKTLRRIVAYFMFSKNKKITISYLYYAIHDGIKSIDGKFNH